MTYLRHLRRQFVGILLSVSAAAANADSIFLCQSYGGGLFWSQAHCRQHNALIDRTETVPSGMPFERQVEIAERQWRAAQGLYPKEPPPQPRVPQPARTAEEIYQTPCQSLDETVRRLDEYARQPLPGREQDRVARERKEARDQQFRLRCR